MLKLTGANGVTRSSDFNVFICKNVETTEMSTQGGRFSVQDKVANPHKHATVTNKRR